MGYQSTVAQLFTVPPNMAAFITVLVTAYYSDKLGNRGYFIIAGCVLGICGYIMMIVANSNAVRYAGTFLVAIGVFQGSPMLMVRSQSLERRIPLLTVLTGLGLKQPRATLRTSSWHRNCDFDCELLCFHRNFHLSRTRRAKICFGPFC